MQNIALMNESDDLRRHLEENFGRFLDAIDSAISRHPHEKRMCVSIQGTRCKGGKRREAQSILYLKLAVMAAFDEICVTGTNLTIMLLSRNVKMGSKWAHGGKQAVKKTTAFKKRIDHKGRGASSPLRIPGCGRLGTLPTGDVVRAFAQMQAFYEEALAECTSTLQMVMASYGCNVQ
jgi:hypothetical protein